MFKQVSTIHFALDARSGFKDGMDAEAIKEILKSGASGYKEIQALGFGVTDMNVLRDMTMAYGYGMDAGVQQPVTTPSIPNLIQNLQNWLPGQVNIMTAERQIDELIGKATVGSWEDEQVIQTVLENTGYAIPYSDDTNLPLTNFNVNYVPRTVVRFETGMRVGNLEEARGARGQINVSSAKRIACGESLEIARNLVGFNGYNSGNDNTYGFLNDPGLSGYQTVAASGSGSSTLWANKTYLQITQDLLIAFSGLQTQTKGRVDPKKVATTLALPTNAVNYLSTSTDFGYNVTKWLYENYPLCRVVSAIQLNTANGGAGVFYLYADRINDFSTDGGATWIQPVPATFIVQGVMKQVKGYEEGSLNATAGAMCKRPVLVARWTGIS